MLKILREMGQDKQRHKLVEVQCSWCFGVNTVRAENAVVNDSCGCVKKGMSHVLAERKKNLWNKYDECKSGPEIICGFIQSRHKMP